MVEPLVGLGFILIFLGVTWLLGGFIERNRDCFNSIVEPTFGGECNKKNCIWHCKNEPVCCANGVKDED